MAVLSLLGSLPYLKTKKVAGQLELCQKLLLLLPSSSLVLRRTIIMNFALHYDEKAVCARATKTRSKSLKHVLMHY